MSSDRTPTEDVVDRRRTPERSQSQTNENLSSSLPRQQQEDGELYPEMAMNRALYDPPRWGWTALGGISDVLSPHERARRNSTCVAYRKKAQKLKRTRRAVGSNNHSKSVTLKDPSTKAGESSSLREAFSEKGQSMSTSSSIISEPKELVEKSSDDDLQPTEESKSESVDTTEESSKSGCKATITPESTREETPSSEERTNESVATTENKPSPQGGNSSKDADGNLQTSFDTTQQPETDTKNKDERKPQSVDPTCVNPITTTVIPQKVDTGIEAVGIPTNILGVEIEQLQAETAEVNNNDDDNPQPENESRKKKSGRPPKSAKRATSATVATQKYDCRVRSLGTLQQDGESSSTTTTTVVDMYAYHQGREGMEARDAETGELLFAQPVTDTNHDLDAPRSTLSIHIEFPLEDDDDDEEDEDRTSSNNNSCSDNVQKVDKHDFPNGRTGSYCSTTESIVSAPTQSKQAKKKAVYREVIMWDLLGPSTPTPIAFATSVANDFGLSFGQMLDLAARIDRQIEKHVSETTQFREPVAVADNQQESTQPRKIGPVIQPYRYDQVVHTEKEGGSFKPKKDNRMKETRSRLSVSSGSGAGVGARQNRMSGGSFTTSSVGSNKSGKRRDSQSSISRNISTAVSELATLVEESDKVSLDDELDDELLNEVKRRSNAEAETDVCQTCPDGDIPGLLETLHNAICHICKKRSPKGYGFRCSVKNHVYCEFHVNKRLGVTGQFGTLVYPSCPICSLNCECAKCVRKLKNVATVFKAKCIDQQKDKPSQVHCPDILSICRNAIPNKELNMATDTVLRIRREEIRRQKEAVVQSHEEEAKSPNKSSAAARHGRTVQLAEQTMVPRPPLTAFPIEVQNNGIELNDELIDPYFTVYSVHGSRAVTSIPDAWVEDENGTTLQGAKLPQSPKSKKNIEVQEDGNVDYCHLCKTAGHLILCDFCPRAFHEDCVKNHNQLSSVDQWECFVCKKEKEESEEHFVDGKDSVDAISGAFSNLDLANPRSQIGLEVLSVIHQMLTSLVEYDFGAVFAEPVDTAEVKGYTDIVKCPMDIGTICSKLTNGDYCESLVNEALSMDDLVTRVLNHIELIWRNCIIFNVVGSSVARMAAVLRRRVKMIYKRSISPKLNSKMKLTVSNYARKFDIDWERGISGSPSKKTDDDPESTDSWKENAIKNHKPKSDLTVKSVNLGGRTKKVAVLDSVNGRIVHMYTSAKIASKAVQILLKSGHRCEWNADAERCYLNLKLIAQKSRDDPNALLFGYRWLFLDDLNEGKVAFPKSVCDVIEMRYNQCTFVFQSIEEALSSSQLPTATDLGMLRRKLTDLGRNGDWAEFEGIKWRRPILPDENSNKESESLPLQPIPQNGVEMSAESLPSWRNCAILKKDLVIDKNLVGFDSIQLALQDWRQTALSSPTFPETEARTMDNFRKYYLDGDRNVDGIVWQSVDGKINFDQDDEKESSRVKDIQSPGEIQTSTGESTANITSRNQQSENQPPLNHLPSTTAMAVDTFEQPISSTDLTLAEESSISRKRKLLEGDHIDFPPGKESRLSIVTVE